eukprot:CAMPEP_0118875480 /NCGR_PEP_ID=MMETSP1163-20130328/16536_1 /TAXON_ID=124430 /ORGANISM="Phaeomonas parva, Strain CCMP2877" /LENGTH=106 /DNA_ID=CAMNT_0006810991 /DNA_START=455 /DNA_END=775 /DNA_ORIENTATION=+
MPSSSLTRPCAVSIFSRLSDNWAMMSRPVSSVSAITRRAFSRVSFCCDSEALALTMRSRWPMDTAPTPAAPAPAPSSFALFASSRVFFSFRCASSYAVCTAALRCS